jgi:hypothetical protein
MEDLPTPLNDIGCTLLSQNNDLEHDVILHFEDCLYLWVGMLLIADLEYLN